MTNIVIVYYSTFGHVVKFAVTIREGINKVEGVTATIYHIPETLSDDILSKMHAPPKVSYPIATPAVLKDADGIIFGFPTRFGSLPAQIRAFFDSTGGLWAAPGLESKPVGLFCSIGALGGGQETNAMTALPFFTNHGMMFVPLGYRSRLLSNLEEIHGGSPWGCSTIAGPDGSRTPSELELEIARVQGESFAEVTKKLAA
ncbi:hypothetical protein Poli38472_005122 [Pythium oligandrum]|uniref:Flavodoxin-like domain-containing protein n=1 Tax=Pythium oligandrum TaxID=41045 RepID=A0A8K1FIW7_PYTOL|nr:hypothetical protein Poli38472_005122 [Pythium oligandrum]|eukprot:TMW62504.1 hypothetical protein Poli38472_005122 [Pythium oligandrum]